MHPSPEVLALLALGESGVASAEEHSHISDCPACSTEVAELAHLAGVGRSVHGSGELVSPSPIVWERIRHEVATLAAAEEPTPLRAPVRPEVINRAPLDATTVIPFARPGTPRSDRRRRGILAVAVAAVLALVAGLGIGIGVERFRQPTPTVIAEAQLAALPEWSGSDGQATLERDTDGKRILVVRITASKPLTGTQQVWLIDPNDPTQMRNIGLLDTTVGRWPVPPSIDVSKFSVVDISEEPTNDPSVAHSGNSIVRGPLAE